MCITQQCFIFHPSDSTVSEDAVIDPGEAVRRSNHSAESHPLYWRQQQHRSLQQQGEGRKEGYIHFLHDLLQSLVFTNVGVSVYGSVKVLWAFCSYILFLSSYKYAVQKILSKLYGNIKFVTRPTVCPKGSFTSVFSTSSCKPSQIST
jgi:hypothetical protein